MPDAVAPAAAGEISSTGSDPLPSMSAEAVVSTAFTGPLFKKPSPILPAMATAFSPVGFPLELVGAATPTASIEPLLVKLPPSPPNSTTPRAFSPVALTDAPVPTVKLPLIAFPAELLPTRIPVTLPLVTDVAVVGATDSEPSTSTLPVTVEFGSMLMPNELSPVTLTAEPSPSVRSPFRLAGASAVPIRTPVIPVPVDKVTAPAILMVPFRVVLGPIASATVLSPVAFSVEPFSRLMPPLKMPVVSVVSPLGMPIKMPVLLLPLPVRSMVPVLSSAVAVGSKAKPLLVASSWTPIALSVPMLLIVPWLVTVLAESISTAGPAAATTTDPADSMRMLPGEPLSAVLVLICWVTLVVMSVKSSPRTGPESRAAVAAVSINARFDKANPFCRCMRPVAARSD